VDLLNIREILLVQEGRWTSEKVMPGWISYDLS